MEGLFVFCAAQKIPAYPTKLKSTCVLPGLWLAEHLERGAVLFPSCSAQQAAPPDAQASLGKRVARSSPESATLPPTGGGIPLTLIKHHLAE